MLSIFFKEINSFLSSLVGYIAIAVFLLGTGLFMWVFPDYSVVSYGFSSMDSFFMMAPYIFLFLIPAITMRSFAEEIQTGTIELLNTRPLTDWQILIGKYLACLLLIVISIIPTFIYFFSIWELGLPKGNLDVGAIVGSYIGLFFLGAVFASIGIFASSLTSSQIVSFILAMFLCWFIYDGLELLGAFAQVGELDTVIRYLGISYHYNAIKKGVIDTSDLIYFLSIIFLFLYATLTSVKSLKR